MIIRDQLKVPKKIPKHRCPAHIKQINREWKRKRLTAEERELIPKADKLQKSLEIPEPKCDLSLVCEAALAYKHRHADKDQIRTLACAADKVYCLNINGFIQDFFKEIEGTADSNLCSETLLQEGLLSHLEEKLKIKNDEYQQFRDDFGFPKLIDFNALATAVKYYNLRYYAPNLYTEKHTDLLEACCTAAHTEEIESFIEALYKWRYNKLLFQKLTVQKVLPEQYEEQIDQFYQALGEVWSTSFAEKYPDHTSKFDLQEVITLGRAWQKDTITEEQNKRLFTIAMEINPQITNQKDDKLNALFLEPFFRALKDITEPDKTHMPFQILLVDAWSLT